MSSSIIRNYYYNPKYGFQSPLRIYQKIKQKHHGITLNQVKTFINNQCTQQIHSQLKPKITDFNQIIAYSFGELITDLLDLSLYKNYNHNYRYILIVQDIESRYLFTYPLKTKSAEEVLDAFKVIQTEIKFPIVSITADEGNEFKNSQFQNHFKDVPIFFKDPELHNSSLAITDRMCRTIRDLLKRYMTANDTHNWIDVLDDITDNINRSVNRTIMNTPKSIYNQTATNNQIIRPPPPKLKVGDKVRIKVSGSAFNTKH